MVDNWFMENVVVDIRDKKTYCSKSYAELLMAIVLWDKVYYPQNTYKWWNSFPSQVQNILYPIDDSKEEGLSESDRQYYKYYNISKESEIIGSRALHYMKLSNDNECDYLPCKKRRDFLIKYSRQEIYYKVLSRMKLQGDLDKTIQEYYTETYRTLLDFSSLDLKMPVLVNFIIDNTPEEMTPIDYAFHLKNEGPVIKYRQYLTQVEDALEEQRWKDLRFLLSCSNDAISSIISMDKNNLGSVEVRILPTPSIILKSVGLDASVSQVPSLTLKKKINRPFRKMHLTFLKNLTKYAINDMKRW